MNFEMINGTGGNQVVYTKDEWMAFKPDERLRLIGTGCFTFRWINDA